MSLSKRERAFGLAGLRVEQIAFEEGLVLVKANPIAASAACPLCGKRSSQVRSRYQRCLADLPAHGRRVRISWRHAVSDAAIKIVAVAFLLSASPRTQQGPGAGARRGSTALSITLVLLWAGGPGRQ